jgi:hypothetical protein
VEFDQIINPNVMALMRTYREMKTVVGRYEREVWEYEQKLKRKQKPAERPPEKKKYPRTDQTASGGLPACC